MALIVARATSSDVGTCLANFTHDIAQASCRAKLLRGIRNGELKEKVLELLYLLW